ncbi:hypothetical protein ACIFUY_11600 [Streptomyces sp. CACIS-1.16CA]|uniref:hypothetical protein n=1 Tax=Streptomyces TaxID=1883 RepID=UPI000A257D55|nr:MULTISPECIES: hypothetical protein [unclassified Streptomyces]OSC72550.1 hypothetical protein B5180_19820 [Streptomyces sp. BF-3]PVC90909.1 hypothetical protein DBP20_02665 [Streptomyces sp. CS131]UCA50595.1 hypothetical protein LEL86_15440 [Streptomyces sp. WA6-1-16]
MRDQAFELLLLREEDLDESFFGEEPSAAYDPAYVSGDPSGRVIVDLTNMLTHGTHPETLRHGSALFTNVVGSVVFHHVAQFGSDAAHKIYEELHTAVQDCASYRMELNDGVQIDITRVALETAEIGDDGFLVRWLSTVDHFRVDTSWVVARKGDVLTFVNTRVPDQEEALKLARVSVARLENPDGTP